MIQVAIGTRAQLLKMAPVMLECERRGLAWRWIYTAQHRDTMQELVEMFELPPPSHVVVRWSDEARSRAKMLQWFLRMGLAIPRSRRMLGGATGPKHVLLTHGDTFTTWLTALMAKSTRTTVMHVESGLRSFNFREPFPEEINRAITWRLADIYACQNEEAIKNLRKRRGVKINTHGNTQIDTLRFGLANFDRATIALPHEPFVVATIHRYENIFDRAKFSSIISQVERVAVRMRVLFLQHPATAVQLRKQGLLPQLERNESVSLMPRLEYLPFIKAVINSEFILSDSPGTQLELYYIGKPTLVLREHVEQPEGFGDNIVLSKLQDDVLDDFMNRYQSLARSPRLPDVSPAAKIVDFLEDNGFGR